MKYWRAHLAVLLLLVGLAIWSAPTEIIERPIEKIYSTPEGVDDVFSERVAEVDADLAAGRPTRLSAEELASMHVELQLRRLMETGPMSGEEVRRARRVLREGNAAVARERSEGSRDAMRLERAHRIVEVCPRLELAEVRAALGELREQMERQSASSARAPAPASDTGS